MKTIVFAYPGNEAIANLLAKQLNATLGTVEFTHFPDGDSYVRIRTLVKNHRIILVCGLDNPDPKVVPIIFFSTLAKELGAKSVGLVTPYLSYMRQDKRFKIGEAINSDYFGPLISHYFDWMVTVDPHLHRHTSLDEVYSIPTHVVHAAPVISQWIKDHIKKPLLVGPDAESEQWVSHVAHEADAPYIVLTKKRYSAQKVKISVPKVVQYQNHTPVLVDDIISTAGTMIATVKHLNDAKMKPTVCIGVHAVFAGDAYKRLKASKIAKIVTCNTIPHITNTIDITPDIAIAIQEIYKS